MDNRWQQLLFCIILGFAGMFLGIFIFDFLDGAAEYLPGGQRQVSFMLIISIGVFLAWIFGVGTCIFDQLHYFVRGLFSTLFLNVGIIWALKNRDIIKKISFDSIPEIVIFILILNILISAFAGKLFEDKLKDVKTRNEPFYRLMPFAVFCPLVMIGVFWGIMYIIKAVY